MFIAIVGIGILFMTLMAINQRATVDRPKLPIEGNWEPVSILKPLKGVDEDLAENLKSFFELDYPEYEIILGAEHENDPALPIAREIAGRYPKVQSRIIFTDALIGYNPKVNNLVNLYCRSKYDLILISDSNTRVEPSYLKGLVVERHAAGGGLVWSLFRGVSEKSFFGTLEALQLNTQVMGGAAALVGILRMPCALGKSMLIGVEELEKIGGFEYLGQFLAEDQIMAEELRRQKIPVTIGTTVIDNVLGARSWKEVVGRQLRWARLRRSMNVFGYFGEILLNPVFISILGLCVLRNQESMLLFIAALLWMSAIDVYMERSSWIRRFFLLYPALELSLAIMRGLIWPLGLFGNRVIWRSNKLTLRKRSRLEMG